MPVIQCDIIGAPVEYIYADPRDAGLAPHQGGRSEKPEPATAGKLDLPADHDLLALPLNLQCHLYETAHWIVHDARLLGSQ
ncbi:MAG: hypothetical protein QOI57_238 [Rubrobacteraceae bacterium]|jgi:hypothetical protein|nr:hypothetical protein [Rubrobacteraceae bacterium]